MTTTSETKKTRAIKSVPEENDSNEQLNSTLTETATSDDEGAVFIYCGPSNSYISRYTSYKNGYPLHLAEQMKEFPTLKELFVEPSKFAEFEQNVVQQNTIENIYFEEAKKYFSQAVKN